jgi:hypothetical protein
MTAGRFSISDRIGSQPRRSSSALFNIVDRPDLPHRKHASVREQEIGTGAEYLPAIHA